MIRLEGVAEFKAALLGTISAEQAATRKATADGAHLIEKAAKEKLGETSHERGTPTPSAPGDPPSLITGNLRRSITVNGPNATQVGGFPGWRAEIGPTAVYGRVQELGGWAGHANLPPRPYMQPAYDDVKPQLQGIFTKAWRGPLML